MARKDHPQPAAPTEIEQLSEKAIATFADLLGGRQALGEYLAVAGVGPDAHRLATLLANPACRTWSLGRLCTQAGITVADFFQAVSKAKTQRAILQAQDRIAAGMVAVVDDVMKRAAPIEIPCETCQGLGTVKSPVGDDAPPVACGVCKGRGVMLALPELDRQKLALDLAKLLPKASGGPAVAIQNNFGGGGSGVTPGGLEQLQQAVNECLFAKPSLPAASASGGIGGAIEAEVIEAEGAGGI